MSLEASKNRTEAALAAYNVKTPVWNAKAHRDSKAPAPPLQAALVGEQGKVSAEPSKVHAELLLKGLPIFPQTELCSMGFSRMIRGGGGGIRVVRPGRSRKKPPHCSHSDFPKIMLLWLQCGARSHPRCAATGILFSRNGCGCNLVASFSDHFH